MFFKQISSIAMRDLTTMSRLPTLTIISSSYAFILKFDHRSDINVQSVFCVIFRCILNIMFYSITVKSYLPILQHDATLLGNHNTWKLKEEMITFNLRQHSAFPTMGVF